MYVYMSVCVCAVAWCWCLCMYVCMSVCVCAVAWCWCLCMYVYMSVCVCAVAWCWCLCMYVYMSVCVCAVASQILQQNAAQALRVSSPGGPTILRALPTGQVQGGVAGTPAAAAAAGKQIITVKAGQGVTQPQIVTLVKTTQGMQVAQVRRDS